MIEARGITKSYDTLKVLRGVDFTVRAGEMVAIVGKSGAGKSTLLHILGTLDRPDAGSLLIDEVDPFRLSPKHLGTFRNKRLGFVFQFHHLLPEFTALENAAMAAYIAGRPAAEADKEAKRWLEYLGLGDRLTHRPRELSGGEQQKVSIARAMVFKPKILMLDESTSNIDSNSINIIEREILDYRKREKATVIIITHDKEQAETLCDNIITLNKIL